VQSADPYGFQKPFQMRVEPRGRTALLHLGGEFDLTGKKEFETRLSEAVSGKPGEVILDLREVVFMDSTGLRLILEAWNRSLRLGFDFALMLGGNARLRDLLLETGLDQAIPVVAGIPAAEYAGEAGTGNGAVV
jgi:anti-anti-sigma factor